MAPPSGYTTSQRIFDDQFCGTSLNSSNWNAFVASRASDCYAWNATAGGGSAAGSPGAYDAEFFEASQVTVDNGLSITAESGSSQSGYSWTSGAISTCGKFEFTGGYLQIGMQQPDTSSGMWPGLWMLPGSGSSSTTDNFEIDLQEGGYTGNGAANDALAYHEHASGNASGSVVNTGVDLSARFHVYGVAWVPGESLTYYLDGNQVGQITSAEFTISNEPMEVILDLQVAQNANGWHTLAGASTPSPSVMRVSEVQVYQ
jgi:beta-glucanase (GH16 family)